MSDIQFTDSNQDEPAHKYCPNCGYILLDDDQGICPRCGYDLNKGEMPRRHPLTDKRFPKWSSNRVKNPLMSLNFELWREILLVVSGIILFQLLGFGLSYAFGQIGPNGRLILTNFGSVMVNLIAQLSLLALAMLILIPKNMNYFRAIFNKKTIKRSLLTGLVFMGIIYGVSIAWNFISSLLFMAFKMEATSNNNQQAIEAMTADYWYILAPLVCIIAPITEELTYRVGLFSALKRVNRVFAYVMTGIIFGLIHFDIEGLITNYSNQMLITELLNLPSYVGAGLVLCWAYEEWGVGGSTFAHIFYNTFGFIMGIIGSVLRPLLQP